MKCCRFHFFLFLFFAFSSANAGFEGTASWQHKKDSLLQALRSVKEDTMSVIVLNNISVELRIPQPDSARLYAIRAISVSEKIKYEKGLADARYNLAAFYMDKDRYDSCEYFFNKALDYYYSMNDKPNIAGTLNNLGIIYRDRGQYQKAVEYIVKAAKVIGETDDKRVTSIIYNSLAAVYRVQRDYPSAVEYYKKSLAIKEEIKDLDGMATTTNNLGLAYYAMKDYDNAIKYFNISYKIDEQLEDIEGVSASLNNIGLIYFDGKQDYASALDHFFRSLELARKIEDKSTIGILLNNIGNVYFAQKKYDEAISYQNQSLAVAAVIDDIEGVKECYKSLAEAYAAKNDFKNAYEYHKKFSDVKDSLLNEESTKQIAEMQTKYETEKKEQQIALLNKDKELQDAQLNRQKIVIWSVACGLLIVFSLSVFIFRERKKSEKLLLNILPVETAKELKANGRATAKYYESVTVMFTDFKGFTTIAEKLSAEELVSELDFLFKKFDEIISKYNIEKIKTIGDAYMCASGLPSPNPNHAESVVKAAMEIQEWMKISPPLNLPFGKGESPNGQGVDWQLRIGIHTGPVTAGVVGDKKFAYDIWGDAVNTASRMESSGEAGKINISGSTYELLKNSSFEGGRGMSFTHRGKIPAKNKGEIDMYFVENIR